MIRIRIPAHIVGDPPQVTRILSMLNYSREQRRSFRDKLRKQHSATTQGEADGILSSFILDPEMRIRDFWGDLGRSRTKRNRENKMLPSLDFVLFRKYLGEEPTPLLDSTLLRETWPALGDFETRIQELGIDLEGGDLGVFMVWLGVRERLARWTAMSEDDRRAVAECVFVLGGISNSTFFLEDAVRIAPALDACFASVEIGVKKSKPEGMSSPHANADESEDNGPSVGNAAPAGERSQECWREVAALCVDALGNRTTDELMSKLVALTKELADLWAERPKFPSIDIDGSKLALALRGASASNVGSWLGDSEIESLLEGWRVAATRCKEAGDYIKLTKALEEAAEIAGKLLAEHEGLLAEQEQCTRDLGAYGEQPKQGGVTPGERVALKRKHAEAQSRAAQNEGRLADNMAALIEAATAPCEPPAADGATPGKVNVEESASRADDSASRADEDETKVEPTAPAKHAGNETGSNEGLERGPKASELVPAASQERESEPRELEAARISKPPIQLPLKVRDTTVTPDEDKKEPQGRPEFDDQAGKECAPIWAAIHSGQTGLALHIADAIVKGHDGSLTVPPPELLRAVCLADYVQSPDGAIARELSASYSALDAAAFSSGPPAWQSALGLLLIAACLRPALLAPRTGASGLLRIPHLGEGFGALFRLSQHIGTAAERLQGQSLSLASFGGARDLAAWKREYDAFTRELGDWRKQAPHMMMKFAPATVVWQQWQQPGGAITQILDQLLPHAVEPQIDKVLSGVEKFNDRGWFRELVRHTDRRELRRHKGEEIHSGALSQLESRSEEALEFARRWLDLARARPEQRGFVTAQLEVLRHELNTLNGPVEEELELAITGHDDPWLLIASAAVAVRASLRGLLQLFAPDTLVREPEPDPRLVQSFPLLLAPDLDITPDWKCEQSSVDVLRALTPLADIRPNWQEAFALRLKRGDADGADKLLEALDALVGADSDEMRRQLRDRVAVLQEDLESSRHATERELETALAYGYFTDTERADIQGRISDAIANVNGVKRFGAALEALGAIRESIRARRAERVTEVRERIEALQLPMEGPERPRLEAVLARGDVLTANEYIQRIAIGESIPSALEPERDYFALYFPDGLGRLEEALEKGSLSNAISDIRGGRAVGGIDLSVVDEAQRKSAVEMLEAWAALKRVLRFETGTVQKLLSGIGFGTVRIESKPSLNEKTEFTFNADAIADRSVCPVPEFGSRAEGRYRGVAVWKPVSEEDLIRVVGEAGLGRPTIVLYFGRLKDKQRRLLARLSREKRRSFLVLDETLLLFLATEPRSRLSAFFHCMLPFAHVEPFGTASSLVPPETFYGRRNELNAILDPAGSCFIYGGRQLGKTALLRHAERRANVVDEKCYAKWIDLKGEHIGYNRQPSEIWTVLYRELRAFPLFRDAEISDPAQRKTGVEGFLESIKATLSKNRDARALLLLDEADKFLEQDSRSGYAETTRLKNLMESTDRRAKVVFAGLHNVLRTTTQANHPLAHFGNPIEIGPLMRGTEWQEARALIEQPLAAAGYVFADPDLPIRILAQTNYYPSLIQLYCEQLERELLGGAGTLDYSHGPRYQISERLVEDAYQARELREQIGSKFKLTLQLDPRYELIAYAMAYAIAQGEMKVADGAPNRELFRRAREWWPEGFGGTSDHEFRGLLDEMVGLGVLRHAREDRYTIRNPNVLLLMGTPEEVSHVLLTERESPPEFAPDFYRAADSQSPRSPLRSPLSFTQESDLLQRRNGVTVIAGSIAAGLQDLVAFLRLRVPGSHLQILDSVMDLEAFNKRLSRLDSREGGSATLIICPAEVPWTPKWIDSALEKIARLKSEERPVRIAFVADPSALRVLQPDLESLDERGVTLVMLRPWNEAFLRQWLSDIGIAEEDMATRHRIAKCTGLWPNVLYQVAKDVPAANTASRFLLAAEKLIGDNDFRNRIREELGLDARSTQVLRLVADLEDLSVREIKELATEAGVAPEWIEPQLQLAEMLHLVQPRGAGVWFVLPMVAQVVSGSGE